MDLNPSSRSGGSAVSGGPSARTQTHALYGSNQKAPEGPAPYTSTGSPAPM